MITEKLIADIEKERKILHDNVDKQFAKITRTFAAMRDPEHVANSLFEEQQKNQKLQEENLILKQRVENAYEEAAKVAEGGSFLHADAPDAKFGRECAAAIRRLKDK